MYSRRPASIASCGMAAVEPRTDHLFSCPNAMGPSAPVGIGKYHIVIGHRRTRWEQPLYHLVATTLFRGIRRLPPDDDVAVVEDLRRLVARQVARHLLERGEEALHAAGERLGRALELFAEPLGRRFLGGEGGHREGGERGGEDQGAHGVTRCGGEARPWRRAPSTFRHSLAQE